MRIPRLVERVSILSGEKHARIIDYDDEDMAAWEAGELIQNAFPYLSSSEREFLMTGITDQEWESMGGG